MQSALPVKPAELLVACLCAQWCRTCDTYRATLIAVRDALRVAHPEASIRFAWVDIEDEAAVVGDLDIEDFPTVVISRGTQVMFAGPVMPHARTLERLVRSALEGALPALAAPLPADLLALPARLGRRPGL